MKKLLTNLDFFDQSFDRPPTYSIHKKNKFERCSISLLSSKEKIKRGERGLINDPISPIVKGWGLSLYFNFIEFFFEHLKTLSQKNQWSYFFKYCFPIFNVIVSAILIELAKIAMPGLQQRYP